jgi:CheY-like chemotaxis protein
MNILLVDDQQSVREVAARVLRRGGHVVFEARSSSDALAIAAQHHIDALVTDLVLPAVDGISLTESVRALLPDVAVVMMSGRAPDRLVRNAVFLPKPFDVGALRAALDEAVSTRPSLGLA